MSHRDPRQVYIDYMTSIHIYIYSPEGQNVNVEVCWCLWLSFYLHGSPLGKGDHKVLPLPMLLHHVGKDDLPVATGPGQLCAVCGPGQAEHTPCVGLLQCVGPLQGGGEGRK